MRFASTGLQTADYLVVFAYMAGLIGFAVYLARRQKTTEDFFVGGRRMPWLLVGVSLMSSLTSTLTYLGTPGELIRYGMGIGFGILSLPLVFLVVGYLWMPFFMRLRLTSAYEYLGQRFGQATRLLGVLLYLYMRFIWMGAILFAMSLAVAEMTGDSGPQALATLTGGTIQLDGRSWFYFVLLTTGVVSTAYTALAGIKGLIWIDFVHFLVLITGAVVTLGIIAARTSTGPAEWWIQATQEAHPLPPLASWDLSVRVTVFWTLLSYFMWYVCSEASDQVSLQLYFTTGSVAAARRTAAVSYVLGAMMVVLLALVGMALLTYYVRIPGELPEGIDDPRTGAFADRVFPFFIAHALPTGLAGLVVAGVFAVAQGSLDSGINSTVTVITVDLVRQLRSRALGDQAELRLARWLTLAIGALATAIGAGISLTAGKYNITDVAMKGTNCMIGPLGGIFMAGMLLPHVGQRAVLSAGVLGAAAAMLLAYADMVPGVQSASGYLLIPLSWLITFVAAALLGGLLRGPRPEQVRGLTWYSVVRGKAAAEQPNEVSIAGVRN